MKYETRKTKDDQFRKVKKRISKNKEEVFQKFEKIKKIKKMCFLLWKMLTLSED